MSSVYVSGEYVENNPTYHVEDSPWKAEQVLRMVAKHDLRPRGVCEVGCGAGEILRQLGQAMPEVESWHGYEVSPQAFELCRQRETDRLRFFCEDLLERDDCHYDLLLCLDVFEHVEDYLGFLRKLRPRGRDKIFHIPLDMSVLSVLRGWPFAEARARVGHLHYFSKDTALASLQDTGYQIVDWFYTPSGDRNPSFKAKLARCPRRLLSSLSPNLAVRLLGGHSLLVLAR